jgi:hypothetical protein
VRRRDVTIDVDGSVTSPTARHVTRHRCDVFQFSDLHEVPEDRIDVGAGGEGPGVELVDHPVESVVTRAGLEQPHQVADLLNIEALAAHLGEPVVVEARPTHAVTAVRSGWSLSAAGAMMDAIAPLLS